MSKKAIKRRVIVWMIELFVSAAVMIGGIYGVCGLCGWLFKLLGVC